MNIWIFIQNQLLGMEWLNNVIGLGLKTAGVDITARWGGSIQFFLYDTLKITVLLCVLIFIISYIQSYFPPERSKRILGRYRGIWANMLGALLGTLTPFCSCSSIPIFIGFTRAGLPPGVTFSFLISSPMVDLGSLILLMSIFGAKVAIVYVIAGLLIAVIGGALIEKLRPERFIEPDTVTSNNCCCCKKNAPATPAATDNRWHNAFRATSTIFKKVFPYILLGVGIGAFIHNWIPEAWVETILGSNNPFGVLLGVIVGAPMYADIFGTIPVAEALLDKGAQLGTILAFMMAATTLSLPSVIMLRKVIKTPLLLIFTGICVTGITVIGCLFNIFQNLFI